MTQLRWGHGLPPGKQVPAAYNAGVHKSEYWETTLEDSLDLIAKLPEIAAIIYCQNNDGNEATYNSSSDYSANSAACLASIILNLTS